jgi:putative phosphoribosyl transferase
MVIDTDVQRAAGVDRAYIEAEAKKQLREIERRRRSYLGGRSPIPLEGRTVIVVDDGIATGTTVRAALQALRRHKPAALVLAVPVAPRETIAELRREVDRIVCLAEPEPFYAIGLHYGDFHQVEDEEVTAALSSVSGTSQSVGQDAGKPQQF